jgi:uncharacterized protein with HEPN domain
MKERDVFVLLDQMLNAGRLATSFVDGMGQDEFLVDIRTQQAVAMSLIIIGEAATRLARDHAVFVASHPDIPLRSMVAMRNRIAHGYIELDFRVIWQTALTDLPELLYRLESIYQAAGEQIGGAPQTPNQD